MPALHDRALILRRFPFGESSLVVQVLTRGHGRVHLLAKGAYRPSARFYAALDLFDTLELEWTPSRGGDLGILRGARILERHSTLARELRRYSAAVTALELCATCAQEGRPDPQAFDALRALLEALEEAGPPELAMIAFELALLHNLGLTPALGHCAACGRGAPSTERGPSVLGARPRGPRVAFSAGAGGRLCRRCAEEARRSGRRVGTLPLDVLDFARSLLESNDPNGAGRRSMIERCDRAGLARVRDFVARFLEFHLESRPKSYRSFLARDNRNAAAASDEQAARG